MLWHLTVNQPTTCLLLLIFEGAFQFYCRGGLCERDSELVQCVIVIYVWLFFPSLFSSFDWQWVRLSTFSFFVKKSIAPLRFTVNCTDAQKARPTNDNANDWRDTLKIGSIHLEATYRYGQKNKEKKTIINSHLVSQVQFFSCLPSCFFESFYIWHILFPGLWLPLNWLD